LKGSLDEDFYKLTGVKSYLVENDAPIKKLLAGETYDEDFETEGICRNVREWHA
jgi:hypothetical protein